MDEQTRKALLAEVAKLSQPEKISMIKDESFLSMYRILIYFRQKLERWDYITDKDMIWIAAMMHKIYLSCEAVKFDEAGNVIIDNITIK